MPGAALAHIELRAQHSLEVLGQASLALDCFIGQGGVLAGDGHQAELLAKPCDPFPAQFAHGRTSGANKLS